MRVIDLNCDLGEGCDNDAELMKYISSANVACGAHAGDVPTMKKTVELAARHGVAVGAHPGYPDRENFGRVDMGLDLDEIYKLVQAQVSVLHDICDEQGVRLTHVKPHGALYNQSAKNPEIARTIAETVIGISDKLVLFGLAGSHSILEAARLGVKTASEVFADRTYQNDGSLTPRSAANALISDENVAVEQVLDMVKYGHVRSTEGIMVPIVADTVCIHGDGANAVAYASLIRQELIAAGVDIKPVT